MEKKCFKCGEVKPLSEYYKHKAMLDGHLNKCKVCAKNDALKRRAENIEKIREYDRNRPNKEQRAKDVAEYHKTEKGKEVKRKAVKKYRQDKLKYTAKNILNAAIRDLKIYKPSTCSHCGVDCNPHGHHDDYSKALDVRWLCVKCHTNFHNAVREKQRELEKQGVSDLLDSHKLIKHVAKTYWSK